MRILGRMILFVIAVLCISNNFSAAQRKDSPHQLDNPYITIHDWAKMPTGRTFGSSAGVAIDPKGNIWVAERCGGSTCENSDLAPILEFDPSGRLIQSFGANMIVFPHGMYADKDGNIWITDGRAKDGKGQQVIKFTPEGKVLMALGRAGVAGNGPDTFNSPSAVITSANGDIFVADGHGGDTNARIVKFSKDGKYLMTWGKKGVNPGEFDTPHALAFDSKGRLLVADRANKRIQIFDQEGKFLDSFTEFTGPGAIAFDSKGMMYTTNSTDGVGQRGIRIGSLEDKTIKWFIADPIIDGKETPALTEGVAVGRDGIVYAVASQTPGIRVFKLAK
jgi:sugar lactone lactonase YvrE